MKKLLITIGILIVILVLAYVFFIYDSGSIPTTEENNTAPNTTPTPSQQVSCNPAFSDYPIEGDVYTGTIAEVDFETYPEANTYQTRIREGVEEGVDIAGHYAIASWGCGTSCQGSAIVDVQDGSILPIPLVSSFDIQYSPTSTLLIVNPQENIPTGTNLYGAVKTQYYTLQNKELTLICEKEPSQQQASPTPIPFYSPQPGEQLPSAEACIQVVVTAQQNGTKEVRRFPTPCHVPDGWTIIDR